MARRARLDAELVRRKLARSREQAAALVAAGRVQVRGTVAHKVAAMVDPADPVVVTGEDPQTEYVSRGGHKLAGALAAFGPRGLAVTGRRCLDAGASTGGFTDVLLRAGAARVVAVDVGYGQLAWPIRTDERVAVFERTNVRTLTPEAIGGPVDLTVADLSFISLRLVLPALAACTRADGDLALMVKPQFEVGKERVGAGGVVRDWRLRAEAVLDVAAAAAELGLGVADVTASPLPGPSGNVEFFVWFRRDAPPADPDRVAAVVAAGPSGAAGEQDPAVGAAGGQDSAVGAAGGQDSAVGAAGGQDPAVGAESERAAAVGAESERAAAVGAARESGLVDVAVDRSGQVASGGPEPVSTRADDAPVEDRP